MLQAKDLQIGDWYAFRGHPYQCTASDIASLAECEKQGAPTDISEIPITEEILEKNFKDSEADYVKERINVGYSVNWIELHDFNGSFYVILDMPYKLNSARIEHLHKGVFNYVHEIQHLFRLCGIEHEIKL